MLEERRASSGKEVLEFHINDNTKISVKCLGSVVGRLKDIIKYHTVVKVISAHHSHKLLVFGHGSGHILMCIVTCLLAAATGLFLILGLRPVGICILHRRSWTTLHILHSTPSELDYLCEYSYKLVLYGHGPGHTLVSMATSCF